MRPRRARRGTPAETRARLVAAAAEVFNRVGYRGTDSNRLARAAGYAPATFYKHFPDKRALFLATYEAWVSAEWAAVERVIAAGGSADVLAGRIVDMVLALHRRWRGLRASLRALVAEDATARAFYRRQRRRQLRLLAALAERSGGRPRPAADGAVLLFTLERVADAVAEDELRSLGVVRGPVVARLRAIVREHVAGA
jgi:AcrR family transcriptional regulator